MMEMRNVIAKNDNDVAILTLDKKDCFTIARNDETRLSFRTGVQRKEKSQT
ncbi:hypothetical protein TASCI_10219 [Tenacibaculum ascidiaceicola]